MRAVRSLLALVGVAVMSSTVVVPAGAAGSAWQHRDTSIDAAPGVRVLDLVPVGDGARVVYTRYHEERDREPGGLYFGRCDTDCDDPASWDTVELNRSDVVWGDVYFNLVVDARGRPRIAWMDYDDQSVKVAVCDAACDQPASWSVVAWPVGDTSVEGGGGGGTIRQAVKVSMAIDAEGRLGLVHTDADEVHDLTYHSCRADCGSEASWSEVVLASEAENGYLPGSPTITFDGIRPRVVYYLLVRDDPFRLTFCDAGCDDRAAWSRTELGGQPDGYSRSSAPPRVVFEGGRAAIAYTVFDDHLERDSYLAYLWCERGCTQGPNWQQGPVFSDMREPAGLNDRLNPWQRKYHGAGELSLVLTGEMGARVSYRSCVNCLEDGQEHRVFLAACDGACGERASWRVERRDDFGWSRAPVLVRHPAGRYRMLFTRESEEAYPNWDLRWAVCDTGCFDPPTPATTTTTGSSSTSSSSSTTTTSTSSTTTTTAPPPSDPDAPSTPTLLAPISGDYPYGEPASFKVRAQSAEGQPYKAVVVVRDRDSGKVMADFETPLAASGLTTAASPEQPLPPARYEWTARAVDTLGRSSSFAPPQAFSVGGG